MTPKISADDACSPNERFLQPSLAQVVGKDWRFVHLMGSAENSTGVKAVKGGVPNVHIYMYYTWHYMTIFHNFHTASENSINSEQTTPNSLARCYMYVIEMCKIKYIEIRGTKHTCFMHQIVNQKWRCVISCHIKVHNHRPDILKENKWELLCYLPMIITTPLGAGFSNVRASHSIVLPRRNFCPEARLRKSGGQSTF